MGIDREAKRLKEQEHLMEKELLKEQARLKEQERLLKMSEFERELYAAGYKLIGGADEVGRGPLAGPVAACVVILPEGFTYSGINDSKKVSAKKREELAEIINENAVACTVGTASEDEIDEINILRATRLAMTRAFDSLDIKPEYLLTDAIELPEIKIPQKPIIKGDAKSITIASASIVAKVYRDKLMSELHEIYPVYGFDTNKGYGSKAHIEAIRKYGPCSIHRRSFLRQQTETL